MVEIGSRLRVVPLGALVVLDLEPSSDAPHCQQQGTVSWGRLKYGYGTRRLTYSPLP